MCIRDARVRKRRGADNSFPSTTQHMMYGPRKCLVYVHGPFSFFSSFCGWFCIQNIPFCYCYLEFVILGFTSIKTSVEVEDKTRWITLVACTHQYIDVFESKSRRLRDAGHVSVSLSSKGWSPTSLFSTGMVLSSTYIHRM